jgi:bifunctional ADP-heptose synthase (sugar kinase/adenylyltransferase)
VIIKIENVVGAKEVIASGGKVVLVDLKDAFQLQKLLRNYLLKKKSYENLIIY